MFPPDEPDPAPTERVLVRHEDGTVSSYRVQDWPADTDEGKIIARHVPGRPGYYLPDASPDDEPVALEDLAPDGVRVGRTRIRFPKRRDADAGTP